MGYDLSETFPITYVGAASSNSDNIIAKYPYVASKEAIYAAILASGVQAVAQRNPNGYTVREMTDKICLLWDNIMYNLWNSNHGTYDPSFLDLTRRFDQPSFWQQPTAYWIAYDETSFVGLPDAATILSRVDIVLLPSKTWTYDVKEYKQKPYLGWDSASQSTASGYSSWSLTGTDTFAAELDINSDKVITGITAGGTNAPSQAGAGAFPTLLKIYDYLNYHAVMNVNGQFFEYNPAYTGHDVIDTSTKFFDLSLAKFSITTAGTGNDAKVTAITAVARNDGNGDAVTGGWAYDTNTHDYQELYPILKVPASASHKQPRVLFRVNALQTGYSGYKATVDITQPDAEFYPGRFITSLDMDTAYAVYGIGSKGAASLPSTSENNEFYQINLPISVRPSNVRIGHERPVLSTTSRSLKRKAVGTGAHRMSWEFEYPPMTQAEAQPFIEFFEEAKGGLNEVQIWVPHNAMYHTAYWGGTRTDISPKMTVTKCDKGSFSMTVDGHAPGGATIPNNTYVNLFNKTHLIVGNSGSPDNYGRVSYTISPAATKNYANSAHCNKLW